MRQDRHVCCISLHICPQTLAKHVMNVHLNALTDRQAREGEVDLATLKKFITYCRRLGLYLFILLLTTSCFDVLLLKMSRIKWHRVSVMNSKCGPRLSLEASEKLKNRYVLMRNGAREHEREIERRTSIPITIRYLPCTQIHWNHKMAFPCC